MPGLVDITGTHPESFGSIVQFGGLPCAGTLAQVSTGMNVSMQNSRVFVLKTLKAAGVVIDGPVVIAARTGHEDVVSAFLAAGADKDKVNWMLNVSAKCLHFRFEFAEGQNTKIQSKYQNSFQAQNAKISAVSTPILTAKAAFFSIFQHFSSSFRKISGKRLKTPENVKNLRTKIRKIWKRVKFFDVFRILVF